MHIRFSDSGCDLQDPPAHIGCSAHSSKDLDEEPFYVWLSGAEKGGKPITTLALRMGGLGLLQLLTDI